MPYLCPLQNVLRAIPVPVDFPLWKVMDSELGYSAVRSAVLYCHFLRMQNQLWYVPEQQQRLTLYGTYGTLVLTL